ncbi:MAG: AAA family ATPase [Candidatus Gracilibacteria bacterium]|jgi:predicted ATPase
MKIVGTTIQTDGDEKLTFGDFNVFIGGNGVGKTTFLIELFSKATGIQREKSYWVNNPEYSTGNLKDDMTLIKSSLAKKYEGANLFYYSRAIKDKAGNVDLSEIYRFTYTEFANIDTQTDESIINTVKYRRPFISFDSCEARLSLQDEVDITGLDQPPQDSINVLYRNKKLLKDIDKTIFERFESKFILLDHTKKKLILGLAKEDAPTFDSNAENAQDEFERIQKWKNEKFTILSDSGHGIRSMIRLLTNLLEPVNQIIMIDEPEMHLYPAQKRWLGKQLVNLAVKQKKQVFLVTHDPMILQGILDANMVTHVFHVKRDENNKGTIDTCKLTKNDDANAMVNQDQYLQGLFYQRCIVVEGASDRSFYQNMFEEYPELSDKDVGFVSCSGKNNTKHMASITSKVHLSASFIYDFDVILFDTQLIKDIYKTLGGTDEPFSNLENLLEADETVKATSDQKEKTETIKKLVGFNKGKGAVTSKWAQNNKNIFDELIKKLSNVGIFIVPNGNLESWAKDVEPKGRFADLAPAVIKHNPSLKKEFDDFSSNILKYLKCVE